MGVGAGHAHPHELVKVERAGDGGNASAQHGSRSAGARMVHRRCAGGQQRSVVAVPLQMHQPVPMNCICGGGGASAAATLCAGPAQLGPLPCTARQTELPALPSTAFLEQRIYSNVCHLDDDVGQVALCLWFRTCVPSEQGTCQQHRLDAQLLHHGQQNLQQPVRRSQQAHAARAAKINADALLALCLHVAAEGIGLSGCLRHA